MNSKSFFVRGTPVPKGSIKAMPGVPLGAPCPKCRQKRRGHPRLINANDKTKGWEKVIRGAAMAARVEKILGPVSVDLEFYMPRPKSHFRSGKFSHLLKDSAPTFHESKPDSDKLERAVLDALTNIAFEDDAKVAHVKAVKVYSDKPGVRISVQSLKNESLWSKIIKSGSARLVEACVRLTTKPSDAFTLR